MVAQLAPRSLVRQPIKEKIVLEARLQSVVVPPQAARKGAEFSDRQDMLNPLKSRAGSQLKLHMILIRHSAVAIDDRQHRLKLAIWRKRFRLLLHKRAHRPQERLIFHHEEKFRRGDIVIPGRAIPAARGNIQLAERREGREIRGQLFRRDFLLLQNKGGTLRFFGRGWFFRLLHGRLRYGCWFRMGLRLLTQNRLFRFFRRRRGLFPIFGWPRPSARERHGFTVCVPHPQKLLLVLLRVIPLRQHGIGVPDGGSIRMLRYPKNLPAAHSSSSSQSSSSSSGSQAPSSQSACRKASRRSKRSCISSRSRASSAWRPERMIA